MKNLATIIAYFATLVAFEAISIAAYKIPEPNLILEIADEYGAVTPGHYGLSIIFEEKMLKSCKPAVAKLQQCAAKAAGEDPKWQQSIMTTGSTARACLLKAKQTRQKDECVEPFMNVLETKCSKETLKMIDEKCKVYNEGDFDMNKFELLMEGGYFDEDSNLEEDSVKDEALNVDENLLFMTQECKIEVMQLQLCVDETSEKDKIFGTTVETTASVERLCLQNAAKKRDKTSCTKRLKLMLQSKCPKETKQVLKVCNIKTGELRGQI